MNFEVALLLYVVILVIIQVVIVKYAWNYVIPQISGMSQITYMQSLVLIILVGILFKGNCTGIPCKRKVFLQ